VEGQKQNISVRLSEFDRTRMKEVAQRMHIRESELFRYAIKSMLRKLTPLNNSHVKGKDLLPVFLECFPDLTREFELDAERLDDIINANVDDPDQLVDRDDIELLVMAGIQEGYAYVRLKNLVRKQPEKYEVGSVLKDYLMSKYIVGHNTGGLE
jgi:hypothetical protein